jgi:hypothetical protein
MWMKYVSNVFHSLVSQRLKKCTLVEALRLCTGRRAHSGSRGISLPFHDHGTRRVVVSVTHRPLFTPGRNTVLIVQDAGWAPGPVWTGAENLAPPGFDPRTVLPVFIHYTDWATGPTLQLISGFFVWQQGGPSLKLTTPRHEMSISGKRDLWNIPLWVIMLRCFIWRVNN